VKVNSFKLVRAYFFRPTTSRKSSSRAFNLQSSYTVDPAAPRVYGLPVLLARGLIRRCTMLYQIVLARNNCLGQNNAGLNPTQQQPSFRILGMPFEGGASMRKAISCLGPILFVAIVLAGCGGSMSSTQTPLGTNMTQVSLTIHGQSPNRGDRALF